VNLLTPRQAHNLKVAGSNPAPATKYIKPLAPKRRGLFACGQAMGKRDDPKPRKITRTGGPKSGSSSIPEGFVIQTGPVLEV
jgi:hypothetical protein